MKKLLFIIIIFGWAFAFAQSSDSLMQSYSLAIESLDQAINVIDEDPTVAQEALVRAQLTLRPMSVDSSSPELVKALETTFDRAKIAIRNKSADDLIIQSLVLKGGYWRLLYESVINSNDTDSALVKSYLLKIANDMNLSEDFATNVETVSEPLNLIANFEKAVAQKAVDNISAASNTEDTAEAYRQLAEAYSVFLPVQDSPRSASFTSNLFAKAFQEIVNDDKEALAADLARLQDTMLQFETASSQLLEQTPAAANIAVNTSENIAANTEAPVAEITETTTEQVSEITTDQANTEQVVETNTQATTETDNLPQAETLANTSEPSADATSTNPMQVVVQPVNNDQAILTAFKSHGIRSTARQQALLQKYHIAGIAHPADL
ncbi:MAG TPA: hypothetical protein ENK21_03555, partial [Trueperaceae bacterium]|nr:hypothetical protein [Trueperaceae bacterium]